MHRVTIKHCLIKMLFSRHRMTGNREREADGFYTCADSQSNACLWRRARKYGLVFLWHRGPSSSRQMSIMLVVVACHVLLSAFLLRMPLLHQEGSGRSARALHE